MATLLVIGDPPQTVDFDAVLREQPIWRADVTEHPVERGVAVSDHVRARALDVELEVLVSDTPSRVPVFGAEGLVLDGTGTERVQRVRRVVDRLRRAQELGELCRLESVRLGDLADMAVAEVREPHESPRGSVLQVLLRQVRVVSARQVEIPRTLEPRGQRTRDRGKQPARETSGAERQSLLLKGAKLLGGEDVLR